MDINAGEVAYTKRVGKLDGDGVFEVGLRGGLHLICVSRGRKFEPLGAGPHRAVARHIAKKKTENRIEFTDLNKADWIEPEHFADCLPEYEDVTSRLRVSQGYQP